MNCTASEINRHIWLCQCNLKRGERGEARGFVPQRPVPAAHIKRGIPSAQCHIA